MMRVSNGPRRRRMIRGTIARIGGKNMRDGQCSQPANLRRTSTLRVQSVAVSIDGFSAGPNQDVENPLGFGGPKLMDWFLHTRVWQEMHGHAGQGETGVDNEMAAQGFKGIGAWILGRNMFGPV